MSRPVHEMTAAEMIAEAERREANRRAGRPLGAVVATDVRTPAEREADDARDEKRVVAAADKQLRALGFRVINTSQPRHAKFLTPGVPDRVYFHRARGLGILWEAKTTNGVQSPAQRDFQEDCEACGWPYVLGTDQVLFDWLVDHGIAARTVGELLIGLPYVPAVRPPTSGSPCAE